MQDIVESRHGGPNGFRSDTAYDIQSTRITPTGGRLVFASQVPETRKASARLTQTNRGRTIVLDAGRVPTSLQKAPLLEESARIGYLGEIW